MTDRDDVERLTGFTYCAYCGAEFPIDGDAADVSNHIRTCEKHPMRQTEVERDRYREDWKITNAALADEQDKVAKLTARVKELEAIIEDSLTSKKATP